MARLAAVLLTVHGLLSFLEDVYGLSSNGLDREPD